MRAWIRDLHIVLTSETLHSQVVFGNKEDINPNIEVTGVKYLSSLKDNFTVRISNLTYKEIIQLIDGQYYDIEIKAGYKSLGGPKTIFKGGVLYISNEFTDKKTNTVIILCTSKLIAKYGQSRMNLSLSSGINMYAALKFICRRAGINDANISEEFRYKFAQNGIVGNQNVAAFIDTICNSSDFAVNSDSSNSGAVTVWNPFTTDKRIVKIEKDTLLFTGGYPRLNSEGVRFQLLPTFNFIPGDTIQVDNSILDVSVTSKEEAFRNPTIYMDANGEYMVFEVAFNLQNRGPNFTTELLCKSRGLIKKTLGGQTNA